MGQHNLELIDETKQPPNDERFLLWVAFLMLSSSYLAASKVRQNQASYVAVKAEIPDIDLVLQLYDDFGDIYTTPAKDWWSANAYKLFGVDLATENLKVLLVSQRGVTTDKSTLIQNIETYIQHTRTDMGNPLTMIVSIPLDMSKKVILGTISEAVDHFRNERNDSTEFALKTAKYSMEFDRIQTRNLLKLLKLVIYKATHPDMPLWEIGMRLRVNQMQSEIARKSIINQDRFDDVQNILSATVSRLMKQARMIAENAARGRFVVDNEFTESAKSFNFDHIANHSSQIELWTHDI